MTASELAGRLQSELFASPEIVVTGFATDNREVKPGDAFLAIVGARVDGHEFVAQAFEAGAGLAVVERPVSGPHILVDNLVKALARLGASLRDSFSGPVVGITGSAGKTTTKELVASALSPLGEILKTEGNRNTEFTAPLLWPQIEPDTAAVVVEMSMRGFGHIAHLAAFSRPTVGIVTNIGHSHLETVGNRDGIARAKGELLEALPSDGTAILSREDDYFAALQSIARPRRVVTFGASPQADCRMISYEATGWETSRIKGFYFDLPWEAELPFIGRHLAMNATAAVAAAAVVGVAPQEAAANLIDAELPPMRMEIRSWRGATLLMDNYNAAPGSMLAALETLREAREPGRKFVILGDMRELGDYAAEAHRDLGKRVANLKFDGVLLIGPLLTEFAVPEFGRHRPEVGEDASAIGEFLQRVRPGDSVLVKGSRALELEKGIPAEEQS